MRGVLLVSLLGASCARDPSPWCVTPTVAWTEVTTPARSGTLIGARGSTLVVQSYLSEPGGYVSNDGGATWAVAYNPGPQDADPIGPIDGMIADPRTVDGFWVHTYPNQSFTFRWTGGANFTPTSLGWPVAPDYVSGGELHDACQYASPCWLERRAPDGTATTLLDGGVLDLATFESDPLRVVVIAPAALGDRGTLRISVDGGATWTDAPAFGAGELRSIERGAGALELWARTTTGIAHSEDGGDTWSSGGEASLSLVPDPARAGVADVVGTDGTLRDTSDGGATWTAIATDAPVEGAAVTVEGLVVDTTVGLAVHRGGGWATLPAPYVPTGVRTFVVADDALLVDAWRSVDGGATWAALDHGALVVAPADRTVVYANQPRARSDDGGATWRPLSTAMWIESAGAAPGLLYGWVTDSDGYEEFLVPVRSDDDGATYTALDVPSASFFTLRPDPRLPDRLYALGDADVSWRSDDRGVTWRAIEHSALVLDPVTAGRVWHLSRTLDVSDDGGDHWTPLPGGPPDLRGAVIGPDGRAVVFDAAREVWAVDADGAWELVGATPVDVDLAVATPGCPGGLLVQSGGGLYLTHSYGAAP